MKLTGSLTHVADLSPGDRDAMFALMAQHYHHTSRPAFEADLAEKRWVIQVWDQSTGALCGFSTQMLLDADVDGRPVKALFSGDTIIDRRHWGDSELMRIGGQLALSLVDEYPRDERYWFLISAGYKTYRFLPVFFHKFYPRHDEPTPQALQQVVDTLARTKYPDRYDLAAGVVRATANQYRLRQGIADITPERRRDPHVEFFVKRNPRHAAGDELCCIAPLTHDNFTAAAYRVLGIDRGA
jgi:hypothetical protein